MSDTGSNFPSDDPAGKLKVAGSLSERRLIYWSVYALSLFLPLFLLAFISINLLYRWNVKPLLASAQSDQADVLQSYIEDVEYLARFDLIRASSEHQADASTYLNSRLKWSPLPSGIPLSFRSSSRPLITPAARDEIVRLQDAWLEKAFRAPRLKADLSFFKELARYDHWDVEVASPIADLTAAGEFVPPERLPIPDVSDLLALAKLRLMSGATPAKAEDTNPASLVALREVRQLARLLLTTENLQLVLTGLALLDDERSAYRHYVDNGFLIADLWTPVDRNVTRRARRAIKATREFLYVWTDAAIIKQFYLAPPFPPGYCAAVNEALPTDESLRSLLKPQLPFEIDLRENFGRLASVFNAGKVTCRWRYLSALKKKAGFSADVPAPLFLSRWPYSRKVFGLRLSVIHFGGFDGYH